VSTVIGIHDGHNASVALLREGRSGGARWEIAVRVLNESVKSRDFRMPFAPSVLAERAADYYEKPKPVASPPRRRTTRVTIG
jgi:predicted NodU family carbamoyl transferase